MKKFTWISLIILFIFSCGSRKKQMTKESNSTTLESKESGAQNTTLNSKTESFTDLSQLLSDKSLKITSNGSPYQLQYGNLIFSGSADVEFKDKQEETKFKYKYFNHTTYVTETKYVRKIRYETQRIYRVVDVDRKGLTFGGVIWIVIVSLVAGAVLWEILKKYLPNWRLNLFNNKNSKND
ncbi:hypothetical protein SAMN05421866_3475 [Chryseobacterium oranimense]|uniref:Lipoprotein n=1 Tax=Chryseobacterium oranimense TaxID=421058 RepID=A0A1M5V048_9FLAO|nr:hypothetical protein [Chryseobacterium oranimense]SHH68599.1 hypothetical protein SAMN05421866_3475 [Chryseobacterium oranimense]